MSSMPRLPLASRRPSPEQESERKQPRAHERGRTFQQALEQRAIGGARAELHGLDRARQLAKARGELRLLGELARIVSVGPTFAGCDQAARVEGEHDRRMELGKRRRVGALHGELACLAEPSLHISLYC